MRNSFKTALHRGDKLIGLWLSMANPYTAEVCATAGFQWLLIDGELSVPQMGQHIFEHILRAASGQATKSELLGLGDHEFVPWHLGIVS